MRTETFPKRCKSPFQSWRKKNGILVHQAAHLFGVTERSVRNWDTRGCPDLVNRMIDLFERDLGGLHPDWKGISIKPNGKMYLGSLFGTTNRVVGLTAEHIRQYPHAIQALSQLESSAERRAQEVLRRAIRARRQLTIEELEKLAYEGESRLETDGTREPFRLAGVQAQEQSRFLCRVDRLPMFASNDPRA
jgi:phage terminase Nu1 subunit (DNA packaging protein)